MSVGRYSGFNGFMKTRVRISMRLHICNECMQFDRSKICVAENA